MTAKPDTQLWTEVYDELRRLAGAFLLRESPGHTLQPTALVHEAYLKLVDDQGAAGAGRNQFMALAAQAIRRVLVDHARGRDRQKRGGSWDRVGLEIDIAADSWPLSRLDVLALEEALSELVQLDARQCRIVEMRFFAGLTQEEIAGVLGVHEKTVRNDWAMAKAWLHQRLERRAP